MNKYEIAAYSDVINRDISVINNKNQNTARARNGSRNYRSFFDLNYAYI